MIDCKMCGKKVCFFTNQDASFVRGRMTLVCSFNFNRAEGGFFKNSVTI